MGLVQANSVGIGVLIIGVEMVAASVVLVVHLFSILRLSSLYAGFVETYPASWSLSYALVLHQLVTRISLALLALTVFVSESTVVLSPCYADSSQDQTGAYLKNDLFFLLLTQPPFPLQLGLVPLVLLLETCCLRDQCVYV